MGYGDLARETLGDSGLVAARSKMHADRDQLEKSLLNKQEQGLSGDGDSRLVQVADTAITRKRLPGNGEVQVLAGEARFYGRVKGVPVSPVIKPHADLTRCLREWCGQTIGLLRSTQ